MFHQSQWFNHGFSRSECTITLTNTSEQPIEMLEVTVQSMLESEVQNQMFKWSKDNLMAQLPIKPGSSASLTLYIQAVSDFLSPVTEGDGGQYFRLIKALDYMG